ncbi:MAG: succinylglutamate desuccinylase [Deltaproteobacteria bacterium]|nr:succinylglutamate desuccinylase [Deltaproteobacteria bacterium]
MRSLTGRIEMCEVILALLASGELPLAARIAEQETLEDDC